jgi:hypothetical protein
MALSGLRCNAQKSVPIQVIGDKTAARPGLVSPEVAEPLGSKLSISDRLLDVLVAEVVLCSEVDSWKRREEFPRNSCPSRRIVSEFGACGRLLYAVACTDVGNAISCSRRPPEGGCGAIGRQGAMKPAGKTNILLDGAVNYDGGQLRRNGPTGVSHRVSESRRFRLLRARGTHSPATLKNGIDPRRRFKRRPCARSSAG